MQTLNDPANAAILICCLCKILYMHDNSETEQKLGSQKSAYRIRLIKRTVLNKLTHLFFTVKGGMASAIVIKNS